MLARRSDAQPDITERFELFITGREMANGFSELNDPEDQAERFSMGAGARQGGTRRGSHALRRRLHPRAGTRPAPTGGCGIGIKSAGDAADRSPAIRDVILFAQMRRES